jgi:hypothetical protein
MVNKAKNSIKKVQQKQQDIFWHNLFYETVYKVSNSPLPELVFVMGLILSRGQPGARFNFSHQLWVTFLAVGAIAACAYWAYRLILGRGSAAHLAALIFIFGFYGSYASGSILNHALLPALPAVTPHLNLVQAAIFVLALAVVAGLAAQILRMIMARYAILKNLQAYKILQIGVLLFFVVEAARFIMRYPSNR